jgi:acyl-CoA hydrolase
MSVQSLPGTIRLCAPQEAAALVRSGDKIAMSANANTPRVWLAALLVRAEQLEQVEIMHMRLVGAFPTVTPDLARHIRFKPLLVPEALRAVAAGYVTIHRPFSPDQQSFLRRASQARCRCGFGGAANGGWHL